MVTLAELEGLPDDPGPDATFLVWRCTELMTKEIDRFTVEDLRLMLGQHVGVRHLLPQAVGILLRDPLAAGDYYPGDLLRAVCRLHPTAWAPFDVERKALSGALREIPTACIAGFQVDVDAFISQSPQP